MKFIKILLLMTIIVLNISAREQVHVNFSNLAITDFVRLISKITKKNILISNKISGKLC
jgi:general secretion pathway protein D